MVGAVGVVMYVITNAFRNLRRNRGRNILVFLAILVILVLVTLTMIIRATSSAIIDEYKSRFGAQVYITPDFATAMTGGGELPTFTLEQQKMVAASSHVKSYSATVTDSMNTSDPIKAVDEDAEANGGGDIVTNVGGDGTAPDYSPNVRVVGTTDLEKLDKFDDRTRTIIEGHAPSEKGDALVSREFAALNDLGVGDTFHGVGPSTDGQVTYDLTVSGIYADASAEYPDGFPGAAAMLNNRNEVVTTFDTVMSNYETATPPVDISYTLHTPGEVEAFKKDIAAAGVDVSKFVVSTDLAKYNAIVKPADSLRNIATVFLVITLVLGAGILILISVIAVRERKYEVGVLRAMGMRKSRILTGFVTESVALTLLALVVALPLALLASKPVADGMLASQNDAYANSAEGVADQQAQDAESGVFTMTTDGQGAAAGERRTNEGGLDSLDVTLDPGTIGQLVGISLALAGAASLFGIIMISRFEPISILSDRN